jgi:hypothetical protein
MVIVVTRKHWIISAILFAIQMPGIVLTVSKTGIHIPPFLWLNISGYVGCTAFVTSLILMSYARVFQKKGRP